MGGAIYREIKIVSAVMPSGATTASGVNMQGYALAALIVPVLTSAVLSVAVPFTGITLTPVANAAGSVKTLSTPGGTGGVAIDSDALSFLAGFYGPIHLSAAAAQAADRTFVWQLKG